MNKIIKKIIIRVLILIAIFSFFGSLYVVDPNEYCVIYQFGKIVHITDSSGLHMKIPFIQSIKHISKQIYLFDMKPSDVITKDKKTMITDNFVLWQITNPLKFVQSLNANNNNAVNRIEAAVYNATKNIISSKTQDKIIKSRGEELTQLITKESNSDIDDYGINIIEVQIKALDLPDDNKHAVYERMISERQNIAAQYLADGDYNAQKIKNITDKDIQIKIANAKRSADVLIAEGESEYMRILKSAYDTREKEEFYSFIRKLDTMKKSFKGNDKTIILNQDSDLIDIFYNVK